MIDSNSLIAIIILLLLIIVGYFLTQRLGKSEQPEVAKREDLREPAKTIDHIEPVESSIPEPSTSEETRGGLEDLFKPPMAPEAAENSIPEPSTNEGNRGGLEDLFKPPMAPEAAENSIPEPSTNEGNRGGLEDLFKPPKAGAPKPKVDNTTIDVFYGTDRKRTGEKELSEFYGGERNSQTSNEPMEYGICKVSIPPNHKVGNIEAPKWWKLEFRPDVKKHIVLQEITPSAKEDFFQQLQEAVSTSAKKQAFVFVHGYNVKFDAAAKRTAQIAYDLSFDGTPIMYSWPSRGSLSGYMVDETNIKWTKPHLQQFLLDISELSGATTIHLIAHSMGNRALTRAFGDLVKTHETESQKFKEIILTAPDIDADVFKNEIAPAMLKSQSHITLYASSNDKALNFSTELHRYPRAGDSGENLVVLPGIDTIDATDANTGLLGHSYFAESVDIIDDIQELLTFGKRAEKRGGLMPKSNEFGDYWEVLDNDT